MISFLVARQPAFLLLRLSALGLMAVTLASLTNAVLQGQSTNYTLYYPDGRRTITVRSSGSPRRVALDQLAPVFGLTFTEDRVAGGLVIGTRGQRIIAVPGQSFIQVGGKVVGLDGQIQRERNTWTAPIDFLSKALGPAIGEPVVLRKASRLILVGNVRVPQVGGKVEKTASGARIVLTVQPMAPHKSLARRQQTDGAIRRHRARPAADHGLHQRVRVCREDRRPVGHLRSRQRGGNVQGGRRTGRRDDDLLPPAPVAPPPAPACRPTPRPAPAGSRSRRASNCLPAASARSCSIRATAARTRA